MAGGGEFVAQVVQRVRLAVCGGGQCGAGGSDQVILTGGETVDLVAQGGDEGDGSGEGGAWLGAPPGAGDGVGPEKSGRFGVVAPGLSDVGGGVRGCVVQGDSQGSCLDWVGSGRSSSPAESGAFARSSATRA